MEKKIRLMSILALAASGIAFLALLLCVLLQRSLLPLIYGTIADYEGFVFPWGSFLYSLGLLVTALILLLGSTNLRIGPWLEILCIVGAGVVVPALNRGVTLLHTYWAGQFGGARIATLSVMNSLASFPMMIAQLGFVFLLVTCGMAISYKSLMRNSQ